LLANGLVIAIHVARECGDLVLKTVAKLFHVLLVLKTTLIVIAARIVKVKWFGTQFLELTTALARPVQLELFQMERGLAQRFRVHQTVRVTRIVHATQDMKVAI